MQRFGQRCGEAKVTVHANAEVSLADQVKDLNVHMKQLERQVHVLEEEKGAIAQVSFRDINKILYTMSGAIDLT